MKTKPRLLLPRNRLYDNLSAYHFLQEFDGAFFKFVGIVSGIEIQGRRHYAAVDRARLTWTGGGEPWLSNEQNLRLEVRDDGSDGAGELIEIAHIVSRRQRPQLVRFVCRIFEGVVLDVSDVQRVRSITPNYDKKLKELPFEDFRKIRHRSNVHVSA